MTEEVLEKHRMEQQGSVHRNESLNSSRDRREEGEKVRGRQRREKEKKKRESEKGVKERKAESR